MNFLTHFALDRESPSSYYTLGVAIPDLLPVAGRHLRLPYKTILSMDLKQPESEKEWMLKGIQRHYHTDKVFHESTFFEDERAFILPWLKQIFAAHPDPKYFFLSHVLVELYLDRILLQKDQKLASEYYPHFHQTDIPATLEWLKPFSTHDFLPLAQTLEVFRKREFLYAYLDTEGFYYAANRTLVRAGIRALEDISADFFISQLEEYETGLRSRIHLLFPEIYSRLSSLQA